MIYYIQKICTGTIVNWVHEFDSKKMVTVQVISDAMHFTEDEIQSFLRERDSIDYRVWEQDFIEDIASPNVCLTREKLEESLLSQSKTEVYKKNSADTFWFALRWNVQCQSTFRLKIRPG